VWPWTAADLDCIYHFYTARSLSDYALKGDRTAQYAVALSNDELAIRPCQSPVRKEIELYAKDDEEKYAYRISEAQKWLPDAAYVAGSIARYCGDKELAAVFFLQAWRSGLTYAIREHDTVAGPMFLPPKATGNNKGK
jgi:hypothetical protein